MPLNDIAPMEDMSCAELVELVTDYFEDQLPAAERERIREHLLLCDGCHAHVEQVRAVLRGSLLVAPRAA
jgi:anti-sigma factor RsiW